MTSQRITIRLEGITAADYLTWHRDPDPPALDYGLRLVEVEGDPLGEEVRAVAVWDRRAPEARAAAAAAGLPLTGEVVEVSSEVSQPCEQRGIALTGLRHGFRVAMCASPASAASPA
jgi:hypothetical protein